MKILGFLKRNVINKILCWLAYYREVGDLVAWEKFLLRKIGSKALVKSLCDPFSYAIKLRTGEIIYYEEARIIKPRKEFLHLRGAKWDDETHEKSWHEEEFPRGIDVRISDIVWVKDAPFGS